MDKIELIHSVLNGFDNIIIDKDFVLQVDGSFNGWIGSIIVKTSKEDLYFHLSIEHSYPFSEYRSNSSIKFKCSQLLGLPHIMPWDSSVCLHPTPCFSFTDKLRNELKLLFNWIENFYINQEQDDNYEFPIVESESVEVIYFTDIDKNFNKKRGFFSYIEDQGDLYITGFENKIGRDITETGFSSTIKSVRENKFGIFILLKEAPFVKGNILAKKWSDIEKYCTQKTKEFIFSTLKGRNKISYIIIGYKIPTGIFNLLAMKRKDRTIPLKRYNNTNDLVFTNNDIEWIKTENLSYSRYFGRGKLSDVITISNIGILGIGAIGSIITESLVRGGSKFINVSDIDTLEMGNICRSVYDRRFIGKSKIEALGIILFNISPFVNLLPFRITKVAPDQIFNSISQNNIATLEQFDLLFDCSTDNEMAYYIDKINPSCTVINISISNNAKEMVVITGRNISQRKAVIFNSLEQSTDNLFVGTGCWDPTFKASYNDIRSLLEYSLMIINSRLSRKLDTGSFLVSKEDTCNGDILDVKFY